MAKAVKSRVRSTKTFYMGNSFSKYRIVAYVLCTIMIFGFFFIYDYVFPAFGQWQLLAIFGLVEFAVMVLIKRAGDWVQKNYYYEVNEEALSIITGKNRQVFPWKNFTSVRLNDFDFANLCPFEYTVSGRKLSINQYLDNPWELNCYIMDHIRDHVEVSDELYKQAQLMK